MAGSYVSPAGVENPTPDQEATAAWGDAVNAALDYFDTIVDNAAWTLFTPTIDQGANLNIAKTIVYSRHRRVGKKHTYQGRVTLVGNGVAGANILVTVPVNFIAAAAAQVMCGTFSFYDASTNILHVGGSFSDSATRIKGTKDNSAGAGPMGQNPNVALAGGDVLFWSIEYEPI